jgi:hypothetical protein
MTDNDILDWVYVWREGMTPRTPEMIEELANEVRRLRTETEVQGREQDELLRENERLRAINATSGKIRVALEADNDNERLWAEIKNMQEFIGEIDRQHAAEIERLKVTLEAAQAALTETQDELVLAHAALHEIADRADADRGAAWARDTARAACAAAKIAKEQAAWPDPTPDMLTTPEFEAVWRCIKTWDINVPSVYRGYCGATGNHVRAILDALAAQRRGA